MTLPNIIPKQHVVKEILQFSIMKKLLSNKRLFSWIVNQISRFLWGVQSRQNVEEHSCEILNELIQNPGLHNIVYHVSSFLDAKSLAQCRLVCHSWKDLIENDPPWLVFQLEHIHAQEKTFVHQCSKDKPSVKSTIKERFQEWFALKKAKYSKIERDCQANVDLLRR